MFKVTDNQINHPAAYEEGYAAGREEGQARFAEMECRLSLKCERLSKERDQFKEQLDSMEPEFIRMRAQLDIVYLIFGGI